MFRFKREVSQCYLPCYKTNGMYWKRLQEILNRKTENWRDLESLFGFFHGQTINCRNLKKLCCNERFQKSLFQIIIPKMKSCLLSMEELFGKEQAYIDILTVEKGELESSKSLTGTQVYCLNVLLFFCWKFFPLSYKTIHTKDSPHSVVHLRCILKYFRLVNFERSSEYVIHFIRVSFQTPTVFEKSENPIVPGIEILSKKGIQELPNSRGGKVVFSNENIGGHFFRGALLQEESLFAMYPECIISMLFCPAMVSNEAIIISGTQQFSQINMNSKFVFSFKPQKMNVDPASRIKIGSTNFVCIDSSCRLIRSRLREDSNDYKGNFDRDLQKCHLGFMKCKTQGSRGIVTGAWGCGAYGHSVEVKFLQQLIGCSQCGMEDMVFCCFGRKRDEERLKRLMRVITEKKSVLNVSKLLDILEKVEFAENVNLDILIKELGKL